MTTVSVICNLILPDGRNRLGGYMTTVSVIGNNDCWWNGWLHDDCLGNRNTAGGMNYSIMRIRVNVYQMEK